MFSVNIQCVCFASSSSSNEIDPAEFTGVLVMKLWGGWGVGGWHLTGVGLFVVGAEQCFAFVCG